MIPDTTQRSIPTIQPFRTNNSTTGGLVPVSNIGWRRLEQVARRRTSTWRCRWRGVDSSSRLWLPRTGSRTTCDGGASRQQRTRKYVAHRVASSDVIQSIATYNTQRLINLTKAVTRNLLGPPVPPVPFLPFPSPSFPLPLACGPLKCIRNLGNSISSPSGEKNLQHAPAYWILSDYVYSVCLQFISCGDIGVARGCNGWCTFRAEKIVLGQIYRGKVVSAPPDRECTTRGRLRIHLKGNLGDLGGGRG